jgi:hypothetical protein
MSFLFFEQGNLTPRRKGSKKKNKTLHLSDFAPLRLGIENFLVVDRPP